MIGLGHTEIWHSCYDKSWKGLIVDEAFKHPAKFSRALVERIYDYLFASGRLKKGDTVVDPFGGVGLGGVIGASRGVQWIGCELEPPFFELAKQNFDLHRAAWQSVGDPLPQIIQGDSRELAERLKPTLAALVISSPPYNLPMSQDHNGTKGGQRGHTASEDGAFARYGNTPGQLEGLPMGDVDAVLSSPPYAEITNVGEYRDPEKCRAREERYLAAHPELEGKRPAFLPYGGTPGQLGILKTGDVDAVLSSPPYEGSLDGHSDSKHHKNAPDSKVSRARAGRSCQAMSYDGQPGNVGNTVGETFWAASKQIVGQCHLILKPKGTAVWVVKDFVRNKKRVPFSDDWRRLCEACGFRTIDWIHATLVRETTTSTMFDGEVKKRKEKKSFFRRLAEKKGTPPIDWEDVLIMEKV